MNVVRDTIPTGFVRLCADGYALCDAPVDQIIHLIDSDGLVWDDDHYEITDKGRIYVKTRLLN